MWHLDLSSNYQKHLSKKNSVSADLKDNIRFKPKGIWGILLTASFSTATSMMIIAPLVIMLLQDKFNAPFYIIAMTYIPMGLVWVFTPKYIVKFISRYGKLAVMAINLIASAISMLFIPIVPALWILALIWAITAMFDVGGNIAEQSLIADLTNNNHYGKGYSLYVFVNDLGAAVGPIVGTALYMKSPIFPFVVASVICLVTGIGVAIVAGNRVTKTYGDETKGY